MKKIFTLLFAAGLAVSASAQSNRHSQHRDQQVDPRGSSAGSYQDQNSNRGNNQQQYGGRVQSGRYNEGYSQNRGRDFGGRGNRARENERYYHQRNRRFFMLRFHRHDRW